MKSLICLLSCLALASASGLLGLGIHEDGQWKPLLDNSLRGQWNPLIDNSLRGQWNPLIDNSLAGVGNVHGIGLGVGLGGHAGLLGGHLIGKRSIGALIGGPAVVAATPVATIGHGAILGTPAVLATTGVVGTVGHGAVLGGHLIGKRSIGALGLGIVSPAAVVAPGIIGGHGAIWG